MFLHIRNRAVQILILGFVVLTVYMYYRTTVDEFHPFIVFVNTSHLPTGRKPHVENVNVESPLPLSLKNTSLNKTSAVNSSINNSTEILSRSTSVESQLSSASTTNLQTSNNSILSRVSQSITSNSSLTTFLHNTIRAIYEPEHDILPEKCPMKGKNMSLVIVVMSAPAHIHARTAIRQTWGHFGQRTDVSVVFMLGTTIDKKLEKIIQEEQRIYVDIIRGKFIDSYSNLTLKTLSTFEWFDTYCSDTKFLLKTDDDMFINVSRLLLFLNKHMNDKNVIFGRLAKKWKPIRNKKSKYYVSVEQFKGREFPDFTTGPAYLLSNDVISKIYNAAMNQTYLQLEDVFATGVVAQKLGIKRVHVNEFINRQITHDPCKVKRGISIHMVKYGEQFDLWKKLSDDQIKCK